MKEAINLKTFDQLDSFLKEVEAGINEHSSITDVLIAASENKDYLETFFEGQLQQFYKFEFDIDLGSSMSVYKTKSAEEEIYKSPSQKQETGPIVESNLDILFNSSDYLHQDYIEVPNLYQKFVFEIVPSHLRLLQTYFEKKGAAAHSSKISKIGSKWTGLFDKKKFNIAQSSGTTNVIPQVSAPPAELTSILLQNWEIIQNQIARSSSIRWTLRGGIVAGWWATMYAASEVFSREKFILTMFAIIFGMIYEMLLKVGEDKLILKSKEIETNLDMIAHGSADRIFMNGLKITTTIKRERRLDSVSFMLQNWKWLLWLPYIVLIFSTFFCYFHYS